MSERGVIAIDRGLFGHSRFADEPFTEREAWVWLIGEAAFRPICRRVGAVKVELRRGQLAHSLRFMAERWKWSEASVRRYLKMLAGAFDGDDALIDARSDAGITVVSIRKYDAYQRVVRFADAENDAGKDARVTQGSAIFIESDADNDAAISAPTIYGKTHISSQPVIYDAENDAHVTQVRRKEESIDKGCSRIIREEGPPSADVDGPTDWDLDFARRFLAVIGRNGDAVELQHGGVAHTVVVWRKRRYDPDWILAIGAELADTTGKKPLSYFYKTIAGRHDERIRELAQPRASPKPELLAASRSPQPSSSHAQTPPDRRQHWQKRRDDAAAAVEEFRDNVEREAAGEGQEGSCDLVRVCVDP